MRLIIIAGILLTLAGCGSPYPVGNLNSSNSSALIPDTAPVPRSRARQLPYETQSDRGLTVSYNLRQGFMEDTQVYWLRLIIRNQRGELTTINPVVNLRDAAGLRIAPFTYDGYMNYLSAMASAEVPAVSIPTAPSDGNATYHHSGTITSYSGQRYRYEGTTRSYENTSAVGAAASGFLEGYAQAKAQKAARALERQENAFSMMTWADANWLRGEYLLSPGEGVTGVLVFPADRPLPLELNIQVSNAQFKFKTESFLQK